MGDPRHILDVPGTQRAAFVAEVGPACEKHAGPLATECLESGARTSSYGMYSIGHNHWDLPGRGDAGFIEWVRAVPAGSVKGGVLRPEVRRVARFSSVEEAVKRWVHLRHAN